MVVVVLLVVVVVVVVVVDVLVVVVVVMVLVVAVPFVVAVVVIVVVMVLLELKCQSDDLELRGCCEHVVNSHAQCTLYITTSTTTMFNCSHQQNSMGFALSFSSLVAQS